jgi:hypothetical protein
MSNPIGSLGGRAAAAVALLLTISVSAFAQREPLSELPQSGEFLSRYDFIMAAAALSNSDPRYSWDTHWAGELDLVDYKYGRMTFLADYQAVLGNEFRAFDPYQSNYLLEASGSVRAGKTEVIAVLNHISRHLGDRDKKQAVAENSLGVRLLRRWEKDGNQLDLRVDLRKVIATAYVDYTAMGEVDSTLRIRLSPRTALYGRVYGNGVTVDPAVANRGSQYGGRAEIGIRLKGTGGVMELYGGTERVYDADPLDRMVATWPFVGFRVRTH